MSIRDGKTHDCKTCIHAQPQFEESGEGRFNQNFAANGYARCSAPRYKDRWYFVNVRRGAKCTEYERPGRS